MAPFYWKDLSSAPRRLARQVAAEGRLVPPIDIDALVARYAEVENCVFPTECDAIVLHVSSGRTRIIVNAGRGAANRRRFTLAHELGHILIPWQTGSFFCHAQLDTEEVGDSFGQMEREANEFAAELLLPESWVAERLNMCDMGLANCIGQMAQFAEVSPITAVIASGRHLKADTLAAVVDDDNRIEYFVTSLDAYVGGLGRGDEFDPESFSGAKEISAFEFGRKAIRCVVFSGSIDIASADALGRESREILEGILIAVEGDEATRASMRQSINGVIGNVNSRLRERWTSGEIRAGLSNAFGRKGKRPQIAVAVQHPEFTVFLDAKAIELSTRRPR